MEPLFINKHVRDADNIKEMYIHLTLKRPIMYVLFGVMALSVIVNIIGVTVLKQLNFQPILIVGVGCGVLYFMIRGIIKRVIRQNDEISNGNPIELTTEIYEDKVRSFSRLGENEMEWANIKKAEETANCVMLRTNANLIFVLTKKGFEKGDYESFCQFLRGKGLMK